MTLRYFENGLEVPGRRTGSLLTREECRSEIELEAVAHVLDSWHVHLEGDVLTAERNGLQRRIEIVS